MRRIALSRVHRPCASCVGVCDKRSYIARPTRGYQLSAWPVAAAPRYRYRRCVWVGGLVGRSNFRLKNYEKKNPSGIRFFVPSSHYTARRKSLNPMRFLTGDRFVWYALFFRIPPVRFSNTELAHEQTHFFFLILSFIR